jgi:hypothetical protein
VPGQGREKIGPRGFSCPTLRPLDILRDFFVLLMGLVQCHVPTLLLFPSALPPDPRRTPSPQPLGLSSLPPPTSRRLARATSTNPTRLGAPALAPVPRASASIDVPHASDVCASASATRPRSPSPVSFSRIRRTARRASCRGWKNSRCAWSTDAHLRPAATFDLRHYADNFNNSRNSIISLSGPTLDFFIRHVNILVGRVPLPGHSHKNTILISISLDAVVARPFNGRKYIRR